MYFTDMCIKKKIWNVRSVIMFVRNSGKESLFTLSLTLLVDKIAQNSSDSQVFFSM
jgi:hypothetical protein